MTLLTSVLIGFRPAAAAEPPVRETLPGVGVQLPSLGAAPLTVDDAVREALAHNPDLSAQRARLPIARSALLKASQLLPSNPEIEGGYTTGGLTGSPGEGDWEVGISQEIEIGGQRGLRQAIADLGIRRAELEIADAERRVVADVKNTFYRLLLAQEKQALVEALVAISDQLRAAAEERFRAQDISQVERDLVVLEYEKALAEQMTAEAEVVASRIDLTALLGRPQGAELLIHGRFALREIDGRPEDLERLARAARPDLQALALDAESARREGDLAGREAIPNLKLGFGYMRQVGVLHGDDIRGDPDIVRGIDELRDADSLLGLRLSIPIPVVDAKRPEIQRAQATRTQALAARDALARAVQAEVGVAYERWRRLGQSLRRYQTILPLYEKNVTLLMAGYRAGEIALEPLLAARERLFRTRLAYLELYKQYYEAVIALERAVGQRLRNDER